MPQGQHTNHGNWHVAGRRMQTSVQHQPTLPMIQVTEGYETTSRAAHIPSENFLHISSWTVNQQQNLEVKADRSLRTSVVVGQHSSVHVLSG